MKGMWFGMSLLGLSVLLCSGLALGCDLTFYPDQDLDPVAMVALGIRLDRMVELSEADCQSKCCADPDCDLALVLLPMDVKPQCLLVNCWFQGQDQCALRNSSQAKVYRKKVDPKRRQAEDDKPRIQPLMTDKEPKSVETKATNDVVCRQPVKVGPCRAAFPKFFYNVTDQTCTSFIYGGCEGNANNFESQDACEKSCSGVTGSVLDESNDPAPKAPRMAPVYNPELSKEAEDDDDEPADKEAVPTQETEMTTKDYAELCEAEPDAGPCRAAFRRWFHNHKTGNCEKFTYGGCRGNKNNHDSKESCLATCAGSKTGHSKKPSSEDVSAQYKVRCEAEPDAGPCRAAFPRWFYNHKTGNCEKFIYGGCRGNENNHDSKESCTSTCTGFDSHHGDHHHERTPAFFLFATLAGISALLLVAVVVVSLRRHRRSRRSSWSDKQELLPEGDTHSSQESLSVPDSPKPEKA